VCIVVLEFRGRFSLTTINQSTVKVLLFLLYSFTISLTFTTHYHNSELTMLAGAAFPAAFLTRMFTPGIGLHIELTLLVGGFVLLLLVTLSVPIIKSIHLLVVDFSDGGVRAATLGVFGACYEGIAPRSVHSTKSSCMPH
jgi:hypothetical protein